MTTHVSNIMALANVGANLGEIIGLATGFILVFASWIPALNKYEGGCKRMLKQGGLLLMAAYLMPRVVEILERWNEISAAMIAWIIFIPLLTISVKALCLPSAIALKQQKSKRMATCIFILNLLLLVPFAWFLALYFATRKNKTSTTERSSS